MNWLGVTVGVTLACLLLLWSTAWMLVMVLLISSRARTHWTWGYVTIDVLRMNARASTLDPSPTNDCESSSLPTEAQPSSVRVDLVLPNRLVIPVAFVAARRGAIMEIRSKVSCVLVATWIVPALAVPFLLISGFLFEGEGSWIVVLSTVGFALGLPASSWVAFRGLRARTRDLRKSTLGV